MYYGTDGMYHDWYLKSRFLSASQGMVGNKNRMVLDFFLARTLDQSLAETVFWTLSSSFCLLRHAELG